MRITLTDAINWAFNIIENQDLTDTQQLTLLHVINRLNRNFWTPTKISVKKLSAVMQKDPRTINDAINFLLNEGHLSKDEKERFNIGNYYENRRKLVEGTTRGEPTTIDGGEFKRDLRNGGEIESENKFGDVEKLEIFSGEDLENAN